MKTKYEYISFEQVSDTGKTTIWQCRNNNLGNHLGIIKWYGPWRQYCYFPTNQGIYSRGCMDDINGFMNQLMEARKVKAKQ